MSYKAPVSISLDVKIVLSCSDVTFMYHNAAVEFNHARCTALIMLNVAICTIATVPSYIAMATELCTVCTAEPCQLCGVKIRSK